MVVWPLPLRAWPSEPAINMLASASRLVRRQITRMRFLLALASWCICQAAILHTHNTFRRLTDESILDLRSEGYQEEDVKQLLQIAGPQGRQQYVIISSIDLVYMCSYAFLLCGLLSMASAVAPFEICKYFNLLPCVAVMFDAVENALILSMLLTYPDLVDRLAPIVPTVSKWKWNFLFVCVSLMAGSGIYCLAVAAGLAGKQRRSKSKEGNAAGGDQHTAKEAAKQQQRRQKRA